MPDRERRFISFDDGAKLANTATQSAGISGERSSRAWQDLIAATHGRAFWILDDLSPLQQHNQQTAEEEVHLFMPSPASRTIFGGFGGGAAGQNPPQAP